MTEAAIHQWDADQASRYLSLALTESMLNLSREAMPPLSFVIEHAAVDMAPVAEAGRALREAREAVISARRVLGHVAYEAHAAGAPCTTIASSAGTSEATVAKATWLYFDSDVSQEGISWRRQLESRINKFGDPPSRRSGGGAD